MSLRRHVCHLPNPSNAPKIPIWISDEVLARSLERFVRVKCQKRYVGLAPGPLEARKRATKRRMMNFAQVGGGVELDPSLLSGLGGVPEQRHWKWQSPKPVVWKLQEELAPWPPWLTDSKSGEATESTEVFPIGKHETQIAARVSPHVVRADPRFLERLKRCKNIEDVYAWAMEHNIELRRYRRPAFRQLCDVGQPLSTLLHALEDLTLGSSGNLNFLLSRQQLRGMTVEDAASLARWIKTQLHLGRLSEEGIQTVLKFVCRIGIDTNDEQMICSLVGSIFEGLRSSSVFRLQDLQTKTISKLFDAITCGLFTRRSQDLGFQIIEQLKLSNTYIDKKTVSSFIIRSFYAQASQQELEKQESRFLDTIPRTIEMLRGFHELGAISIVDITSRSLINGESHLPVSNNARLKILAFWWSALAKSRVQSSQGTTRTDLVGKEVERLMSVQKLEVVVPYLVHLADIRKARFILEYWLGLDMSDGHLVKAFDTLCRSQDECDPFLAMFRVVGDFTTWEQAKIGRIFRVLQMLQKPETIVTIIKDSNIAKTMIDESTVLRTIRTYARPNPMLAERIFSFSRKLTLERCPELAERIILHQTFHPNTALHYFRTRSPLVNVVRNRQRTVRLRAHLLQRMALAYSSARHLSPRISFRKVYDCYRCHKSERLGPLGVGMTQALARAGIIRPLRAGQWVSTQKLRWILSVIRHVESADVADRADAMVYKWRGVNIRNIQMRLQREKGARGQWTNVPPKIRIRNKWSRYWRRYERIMTL